MATQPNERNATETTANDRDGSTTQPNDRATKASERDGSSTRPDERDAVRTRPGTQTTGERDDRLRVLNLVTNAEARFYKQQVSVLEERGVDCTTVAVPAERVHGDDEADGRPATAYARFYATAIGRSFGDFDLVHANYGLTAPPAVLQPSLPTVVSLWGSDLLGKYGRLSRLCARYSDEVIVMADHMADELGRDCHVIPHGVDFDRFQPESQSDARAELSWDPAAAHVLFPYPRSKTIKNPERAERIVAAARDRLERPVELQFVSGVPHERMPVYMNAADALLLTSEREGSPNSVKEALACNLPVIATDVGDVRQRLTGVTHSYVSDRDADLVDCLVSVLEAGVRSNGREAVDELRIDRMADRIVEVYRDAVDG